MELRDKLNPADVGTMANSPAPSGAGGPVPTENKIRDAVLALVALGYKAADADKSVRQAWVAIGASASTEALIKKALG
jgi:Holliday junction DNA helicase RuvA